MRRKNHIAKDLRTPKYKQRVVPNKTKDDRYEKWDPMKWLDHLDGRDDD